MNKIFADLSAGKIVCIDLCALICVHYVIHPCKFTDLSIYLSISVSVCIYLYIYIYISP